MKRLLVLFILLFTVCFTYTVVAQELGLIKKGIEISFPEKIHKLVLDPLPAGTYSVGTGGYFPTIDSAFNKLSIDGIAGEVILELTDNLYTAPTDSFGFFLNGPIPGAGPTSRVTIKPATNKNVTIEGNGLSTLSFLNTSYLALDGVGLSGATTFTIHALYNAQFQGNTCANFYNNSDHNIVQNATFISEDYAGEWTTAGTLAFWTLSGFNVSPDSNLIQNNFIKKAGTAIYVSAYYASVRAVGNIIRGNRIGSESDSLVAFGIQVEHGQNTIIESNIVQNIRYYTESYYYAVGINSYWGSSDVIRNNIVQNINAWFSQGGSMGIILSGYTGQIGNDNQIYNNMVYNIGGSSHELNSHVAGIQMWWQTNPKIYFNSVYLTGTGSNHLGSAALYIWYLDGPCLNVDVKNNIFVNTRNESPYCASAVYDYTAANLTSDYNDLYYDDTNPNNCLVRAGTDYHTLAEWQATGKDLESITEIPNFIDPYLHIDQMLPTNLEGGATPITGIETDFDGDNRNAATPDIGADEFVLDQNAASWQVQNSNFPADITVTNFSSVNDLVCWAGGFKYGQLPYPGYIRTTDGGNTWVCDSIPGIPDGLISQVFAIDADTAYIAVYVMSNSNSKGVYKTTDGGNTWTKQNAYSTAFYGPGNIYFFDASNGVVIGDPNLETYTTTNGGQTWNPVSMQPLADEYTWISGTGITGYGNSVWFHSTHRIFRSTDRGKTWIPSSYDPQYYFWWPCIAFQDENTGIYSRENWNTLEQIYQKTTDGGVTWDTLSNPILDNLAPQNIIHIPGTTATYLVAGGLPGSMQGLAVTFDAGETWSLWNTLGCAYIGFSSVESGWTTFSSTWQVYKYIGSPIVTVEEEEIDILPIDYSISQNYPNPFNPTTTFRYSIPTQSKVVIKVYDILGKEIATLMNEEKSVGTYELTWNAENLPSGVYCFQLKAGAFIDTKKMILLK